MKRSRMTAMTMPMMADDGNELPALFALAAKVLDAWGVAGDGWFSISIPDEVDRGVDHSVGCGDDVEATPADVRVEIVVVVVVVETGIPTVVKTVTVIVPVNVNLPPPPLVGL
jgi:hypothetical protein